MDQEILKSTGWAQWGYPQWPESLRCILSSLQRSSPTKGWPYCIHAFTKWGWWSEIAGQCCAWKSSAQVVTFKQSSSIMSSKFAKLSYISSSHRSKALTARLSSSDIVICELLGRSYQVECVCILQCASLVTCICFMIDLVGVESNSGLRFWISQQKLLDSLWARQQLRLRLIDATLAQPTHLGVLWSYWSAQIVDPGAALDDLNKPEPLIQII